MGIILALIKCASTKVICALGDIPPIVNSNNVSSIPWLFNSSFILFIQAGTSSRIINMLFLGNWADNKVYSKFAVIYPCLANLE